MPSVPMRALPEEQRQESMLAILEPYRHPQRPLAKSLLPAEKFRAASEAAGLDIPHLSAELIADLRHLRLL